MLRAFLIFIMALFVACAAAAENKNEKFALESYSFCTPAETEYRIGLVGESWALEMHVPRGQIEKSSGTLSPRLMTYYQGETLFRYIAPSAGPRRPPVPDHYIKLVVNEARVQYQFSDQGLLVQVQDVNLNGKSYSFENKTSMPCLPPRP